MFFDRKSPEPAKPSAEAPSFEAYVFFDEPLSFRAGEIAAAVAEDHPSLGFGTSRMAEAIGDPPLRTGDAMPAMIDCGDGSDSVLLCSAPNFRAGPPPEVWAANRMTEAEAFRHRDHAAYLSVSSKAPTDDLPGRVAAAMRVTAVVRTLAALRITSTVWFPSGNRIHSAEKLLSHPMGADPVGLTDWVLPLEGSGADGTTARSSGLHYFTGYEIGIHAPTDVSIAPLHLLVVLGHMAIDRGHVFGDDDTMSLEGGETPSWRIRAVAATDAGPEMRVFLHPDAPVDEVAVYGARPKPRPKRKYDGDGSWLSRRLAMYKPGAAGRA